VTCGGVRKKHGLTVDGGDKNPVKGYLQGVPFIEKAAGGNHPKNQSLAGGRGISAGRAKGMFTEKTYMGETLFEGGNGGGVGEK